MRYSCVKSSENTDGLWKLSIRFPGEWRNFTVFAILLSNGSARIGCRLSASLRCHLPCSNNEREPAYESTFPGPSGECPMNFSQRLLGLECASICCSAEQAGWTVERDPSRKRVRALAPGAEIPVHESPDGSSESSILPHPCGGVVFCTTLRSCLAERRSP